MLRFVTPKLIVGITLLVACGLLISCSSGSKSAITNPTTPNVAGPWQLIAISTDGSATGIEVALTEGQVLVNGVEQPDGQIAADSAQITFVSLNPANSEITGFGGSCLPVTTANTFGPGTVTALGAPISFSFTENGNVFNVTATISGDGTSILNGTYTPQTGNTCTDPGGTITGTLLSKLSGTYTGTMCPLASTCQSSSEFTDTVVSATVSESSSNVLTLGLVLSGTDNTNFTLTGPVTGNAFSATGTFQGQTLTYYGYYEQLSSVPTLYLVNGTNPAQPFHVGTLAQ